MINLTLTFDFVFHSSISYTFTDCSWACFPGRTQQSISHYYKISLLQYEDARWCLQTSMWCFFWSSFRRLGTFCADFLHAEILCGNFPISLGSCSTDLRCLAVDRWSPQNTCLTRSTLTSVLFIESFPLLASTFFSLNVLFLSKTYVSTRHGIIYIHL